MVTSFCPKLLTSRDLVKTHYHGLVLSLFSHFCFFSSEYDEVGKGCQPSCDVQVRLLIPISCLVLVYPSCTKSYRLFLSINKETHFVSKKVSLFCYKKQCVNGDFLIVQK